MIYGVLENEAMDLNEVFVTNMQKKRPFIALKTATTIDGKISTRTGSSKWITSNKSREKGRELRTIYDAVLTTSSTVIADNPNFNNDFKILLDRNLRVDLEKKFFKSGKILVIYDEKLNNSVIDNKIFCCKKNISEQQSENIEFIPCPVKNDKIDINSMLQILFERKIMSIFVETGGVFNGSMIESGFVDKIYHFIAPKILGDNFGQSAFSGRSIENINDCINYEVQNIKKLEKDILITYKRANC